MTTNLDIDLLRSFATIARLGNFTRAGQRLGRQQSTISLQIQRLEDQLGQRLIVRTPRSMSLTEAGHQLLDHAETLLSLNDAMVAMMRGPRVSGVVRLGTPEDFATRHLAEVLSRFAEAYPLIELQVSCDLTLNLLEQFREGSLDIALVKREPGAEDASGTRVWREPLVWVMRDRAIAERADSLPLVLSPAPCVYRKRAIDALEAGGRSWRVAYSCASLAGSLAAVRAGLGVTVLPKDMVPSDLAIIDRAPLPDLYDTEIALLQRPGLSQAAQILSEHMIRCLG